MNEPLVQTQVIPYLRELVKGGHELTLLTFEPGDVGESAVRESLASEGIEWRWLRYHKHPSVPATLFDISNAVRFIRKLMKKQSFDILHARSHVPMMMAALARKVSLHKPRLLFDIRGFMPEEYVDAGVWREGGAIYRNVKRAEDWLMKEADGFVVLTEKARSILSDQTGSRPVEVIPCCVDLKRFVPLSDGERCELRERRGVAGRKVIAYVGSFGGWYLSEELIDFFVFAHEMDSDVFPLILTQRDTEKVRNKLRMRGFSDEEFLVESVKPDALAEYLNVADVSLSFINPCYSKLSSSPTKLAEYLACGLPIISNQGVGDVDALIRQNSIGALIDEFNEESYRIALSKVEELGNVRQRCRSISEKEFDLRTVGGQGYRNLYERISSETDLGCEMNRDCPACRSNRSRSVGKKWDWEIVQCSDCGTLLTRYAPTEGSEQDYDDYGYGDIKIPDFIAARCDELVKPFVFYRRLNRFLEIGFGAGTIISAAARAGWNVSGVEMSRAAVRSLSETNPEFDLYHGSVEACKFPDNSFDAIAIVEVVEHVLDPQAIVKEAFRIVRPGGVVWVTTPNAGSISRRLLGLHWSMVAPPDHLEIYSLKGSNILLTSCGFQIEKVETFGLNPYEIFRFFRTNGTEVTTSERLESGYELTASLQSGFWGRSVKAAINGVLDLVRMGDGIKIWATKPVQPSSNNEGVGDTQL